MKTQSTRHTPGPWKFDKQWAVVLTDEQDPQTIAYTSDHRNRKGRSKTENVANACLMAAAPELLEACIAGGRYCDALLKYQDHGITGFVGPSDELEKLFKDWHDKTHAAIAKATGETV